ncbi:MAG TPA: hypothetical protein VNI02_14265 [Blastocatellia bacterium]|jgi:hypothetical protein|nr:hypothetical protein [Blastocatellia bacterium]
MLIDDYLSSYDVSAKYGADVRAPADHVYEAVRGMDLSGSSVIRLLFRLREFPAIFKSRKSQRALGLTLDNLLRSGFILLGEDPPREILLGVVGQFWTSSGCIQKLDANGFRTFDEKGYAKAAWNFSVSERGPGVCALATETRVRCLDEGSLRRFRLYWTLVGPFSGVIRKETLRVVRRQAEASCRPYQPPEKNQ